jgi:hypothetical protein
LFYFFLLLFHFFSFFFRFVSFWFDQASVWCLARRPENWARLIRANAIGIMVQAASSVWATVQRLVMEETKQQDQVKATDSLIRSPFFRDQK